MEAEGDSVRDSGDAQSGEFNAQARCPPLYLYTLFTFEVVAPGHMTSAICACIPVSFQAI